MWLKMATSKCTKGMLKRKACAPRRENTITLGCSLLILGGLLILIELKLAT